MNVEYAWDSKIYSKVYDNIDDLRKSYYELDKLSFPYEIDNENNHNLIGRSK